MAMSAARPKTSMAYLFSRPRPASTPNHSQSREFPVRTTSMITATQPIQNSGSKAPTQRMLCTPKKMGAPRMHTPASPCAKRPPPICRARTIPSATVPAPARAGSRRTAGSEPPSHRATFE